MFAQLLMLVVALLFGVLPRHRRPSIKEKL